VLVVAAAAAPIPMVSLEVAEVAERLFVILVAVPVAAAVEEEVISRLKAFLFLVKTEGQKDHSIQSVFATYFILFCSSFA
jgi:hypothetical protein